MPHKIDVLNELENEYTVNGKDLKEENIQYYKSTQTHFNMNELEALEDYIRCQKMLANNTKLNY